MHQSNHTKMINQSNPFLAASLQLFSGPPLIHFCSLFCGGIHRKYVVFLILSGKRAVSKRSPEEDAGLHGMLQPYGHDQGHPPLPVAKALHQGGGHETVAVQQ